MNQQECINMLIKNIYDYRDERDVESLRGYLLGNQEYVGKEIDKRVKKYILSPFPNMTVSNRGYISVEWKEVIERYVSYLLKEKPEVALSVFRKNSNRYMIYNSMDVDIEIVEEDIAKSFKFDNYIDYDMKLSLENIEYYYKGLIESYIKDIDKVDRGIIIEVVACHLLEKIEKSQEIEEKDIKLLEKIMLELLFNLQEKDIKRVIELVEEGRDEEFKSILERYKPKKREYEEENTPKEFFRSLVGSGVDNENDIMDRVMEKSTIIKSVMKYVVFSNKKYFFAVAKAITSRRIKLYERFDVPTHIGVKNILEVLLKMEFKREYLQLLNRLIIKDGEGVKKYYDNLHMERWEERAILYVILKNYNLLDEDSYLERIEEKLLKRFEKAFIEERESIVKIDGQVIESVEFMKNETLPQNITIEENIQYRGEIYSNVYKDITICMALLDYSVVARNRITMLARGKEENYNLYLVDMYREIVPKNENIYIRMYERGIDLYVILLVYAYECPYYIKGIDYERHPNGVLNRDLLAMKELGKKYPNVVNEILQDKEIQSKKFQRDEFFKGLLVTFFGKSSTLPFEMLAMALEKKSKSVAEVIEELLLPREKECRHIIEEYKNSKSKITSTVAKRLLTQWGDIEENTSGEGDNMYQEIEKKYSKVNEKNLPYLKDIDYSKVTSKGEYVSEKVIKYIISEVIILKELEIPKEIKNIIDTLDRDSFVKLVREIFEKWVEDNPTPKNKMILLLVGYMGDIATLEEVRKLIVHWSENSKPSMVRFAGEALVVGGRREALVMLNDLFRKSKNKSIKKNIGNTLEIAHKILGISKMEYEELLITDYGFGKDRARVFDYGSRKIKIVLNSRLDIEIYDESGKNLKSMPRYSEKQGDNLDLVEKAKEEVKVLKKQIANMVKEQSRRLFINTFTRKYWTREKWIELFVENSIMNIFATQLIWEEIDEEQNIIKTFRYMEDGSFNNIDEEECSLGEKSCIRLLFPSDITKEELNVWREQLEDYEITQPFEQVDIYIPTLNDKEKEEEFYSPFPNQEFYSGTFRSVIDKVGFEIDYMDTSVYSNGINEVVFYDSVSGIEITLVLAESFDRYDYGVPVSIDYFSFCGARLYKLKEVPLNLLAFAYYVGEMLVKR